MHNTVHKTGLKVRNVNQSHFSSGNTKKKGIEDSSFVTVTLLDGSSLLASNIETGKSDPVGFIWCGYGDAEPVWDKFEDPAQRIMLSTTCSKTIHPVWNEEFTFPIEVPSLEALLEVRCIIRIRDEERGYGGITYADLGQTVLRLSEVIADGRGFRTAALLASHKLTLERVAGMRRVDGYIRLSVSVTFSAQDRKKFAVQLKRPGIVITESTLIKQLQDWASNNNAGKPSFSITNPSPGRDLLAFANDSHLSITLPPRTPTPSHSRPATPQIRTASPSRHTRPQSTSTRSVSPGIPLAVSRVPLVSPSSNSAPSSSSHIHSVSPQRRSPGQSFRPSRLAQHTSAPGHLSIASTSPLRKETNIEIECEAIQRASAYTANRDCSLQTDELGINELDILLQQLNIVESASISTNTADLKMNNDSCQKTQTHDQAKCTVENVNHSVEGEEGQSDEEELMILSDADLQALHLEREFEKQEIESKFRSNLDVTESAPADAAERMCEATTCSENAIVVYDDNKSKDSSRANSSRSTSGGDAQVATAHALRLRETLWQRDKTRAALIALAKLTYQGLSKVNDRMQSMENELRDSRDSQSNQFALLKETYQPPVPSPPQLLDNASTENPNQPARQARARARAQSPSRIPAPTAAKRIVKTASPSSSSRMPAHTLSTSNTFRHSSQRLSSCKLADDVAIPEEPYPTIIGPAFQASSPNRNRELERENRLAELREFKQRKLSDMRRQEREKGLNLLEHPDEKNTKINSSRSDTVDIPIVVLAPTKPYAGAKDFSVEHSTISDINLSETTSNRDTTLADGLQHQLSSVKSTPSSLTLAVSSGYESLPLLNPLQLSQGGKLIQLLTPPQLSQGDESLPPLTPIPLIQGDESFSPLNPFPLSRGDESLPPLTPIPLNQGDESLPPLNPLPLSRGDESLPPLSTLLHPLCQGDESLPEEPASNYSESRRQKSKHPKYKGKNIENLHQISSAVPESKEQTLLPQPQAQNGTKLFRPSALAPEAMSAAVLYSLPQSIVTQLYSEVADMIEEKGSDSTEAQNSAVDKGLRWLLLLSRPPLTLAGESSSKGLSLCANLDEHVSIKIMSRLNSLATSHTDQPGAGRAKFARLLRSVLQRRGLKAQIVSEQQSYDL